MGNSQLNLDWSLVSFSIHPPISLDESECDHYTSATSFKTYSLTSELDSQANFYLAKDETDKVFHLHLYPVDDFDGVREVRSKVQFVQEWQKELRAAKIVDIIEEPKCDGSWTVAVISEVSEFVNLETWLEYWNQAPNYDDAFFALDDVIEGLISVLEVAVFAHTHEQWLGQLLPHNILICRTLEDNTPHFSVRLDLLHSQCFADLSESKTSILNPPEGRQHTYKRDMWDLGISLLTAIEQKMVSEDVTADFVKRCRLPAALKHLLLLLFRTEDQRPGAQSILLDPVLVLFRMILHDEEVSEIKVNHIPALCLGLRLRNLSRKQRCLNWLLYLLQNKSEAEIGDQDFDVDWSDLASAVDLLDLTQGTEEISLVFRLVLRMMKTGVDPVSIKQSGFLRFVFSCLQTYPVADPRSSPFIINLLAFVRECGSASCLSDVYSSKFLASLKADCPKDVLAFVGETCYRLGSRSFDLITDASHLLKLSPTDKLALLKNVSLHSYQIHKPTNVSAFLKESLMTQGTDIYKDVTAFLSVALFYCRTWSNFAFNGICLSSKADPLGAQMYCELGYNCATCKIQVCQACLPQHDGHAVSFCGRVICQSPRLQKPAQLFESLMNDVRGFREYTELSGPERHESRGLLVNMQLSGPERREFQLTATDILDSPPGHPEYLRVYSEIIIKHGGDTDNFEVSVASPTRSFFSYSSQTGLITSIDRTWPGPVLGPEDVIGLGITSYSRIFVTFNGVIHPAIVASPQSLIGSKVVFQLGIRGLAMIQNQNFLFGLKFCQQPLNDESILRKSSRILNKTFWNEYKNVSKSVADSHPGQVEKAILEGLSPNPDQSQKREQVSKGCSSCSLF